MTMSKTILYIYNVMIRNHADDVELDEDLKREANAKRVVIDKATGKPKEVDIYDRAEKRRRTQNNSKQFSQAT